MTFEQIAACLLNVVVMVSFFCALMMLAMSFLWSVYTIGRAIWRLIV